MKAIARTFLVVLLALAATPAAAVFHLWRMSEMYSSADGRIQFLELYSGFPFEERLTAHRITAYTAGGVARSAYVFPNDLPSSATTDRRFLIGTTSFAALGVVTPDYIVPDGFFATDGGSVDFAGVDTWEYTGFPGGTQSRARDGSIADASPTNFAGQTGVLPAAAPTALNVQALWWRAPANSESGWGLNITQQGEILFATWFTYDVDGSGLWLVASDMRRTSDNTYSGTLYQTRGPAFSATAYANSQFQPTSVGTITLAFTDANNGTFTYTVKGVTGSKPITRYVYSSPVPTCSTTTSSGTPSYQDLWWRSPAGSENGWGINITHQGDTLFATWFTYAADGSDLWMVMSAGTRVAPATYRGEIHRTAGPPFNATTYNPALFAPTLAGTGTFTFTDADNGTFSYTIDGVTQSKPITRYVFQAPATRCTF